MKSKFILAFLKVSVTILFYFLVIVTVFFLVTSVITISGNNPLQGQQSKQFSYKVQSFGRKPVHPPSYSSDKLISYQPVTDNYTLEVKPNSGIGYYSLVSKTIFMLLGIAILWNFMKIFKETKLENPFKQIITYRLKILAALFIIADIFKFIDYFIFNSFLVQSISSPHFKLITDTGNGIVTGLIIWIIAMIYQRGIDLQEENSLTV